MSVQVFWLGKNVCCASVLSTVVLQILTLLLDRDFEP